MEKNINPKSFFQEYGIEKYDELKGLDYYKVITDSSTVEELKSEKEVLDVEPDQKLKIIRFLKIVTQFTGILKYILTAKNLLKLNI